jgi:hypothetical protein
MTQTEKNLLRYFRACTKHRKAAVFVFAKRLSGINLDDPEPEPQPVLRLVVDNSRPESPS